MAVGGTLRGVERRGLMFVLSSPSGAGKSTLARMLIDTTPSLRMSVSVTTRAKRPGEIDGEHYHFIDKPKFDAMVMDKELLEHATVFDNSYGTPRKPVEDALSSGQDVLFDIDWQGTQQLREKARADVVTVFILPPSARDLEHRLHTRAQDSDEVIQRRMTKAGDEMNRWSEYDYIIINENVGLAFEAVKSVLIAERLKRERQTGLSAFVRELQKQLEK